MGVWGVCGMVTTWRGVELKVKGWWIGCLGCCCHGERRTVWSWCAGRTDVWAEVGGNGEGPRRPGVVVLG